MATKTWYTNRDARTAQSPSSLGGGACAHLDVGSYGGYDYQSHIGFAPDWSGIPNSAAISSAVLYVYRATNTHITASAGTVRARSMVSNRWFGEGTASHPMTADNGGGIVGSTRGTVEDTTAGTASVGTGLGVWVAITVTAAVKYWWQDANLAFTLTMDSGVTEFSSKEGTASPYLVVTYNPNSAPNAPTLNSPGNWTGTTSQSPTLNFTPSDPDGDAHTAYTYQVDDNADFSSPVESIEVGGSFTNGVAVNRAVQASLARGSWYYWRVATRDATNGYGPYSSAFAFFVNTVPTCSVTSPTTGMVAGLYYNTGDGTPHLNVTWSYSNADGNAQTGATIRIYNDSDTLVHTHTHTGANQYASISGYGLTNLAYYRVSVQVTAASGLSSTETAHQRTRVCWARASYYYNMGATPPAAWSTPVVNATGNYNVVEWSSSTSTAEPGTWYASLANVPLPNGADNYVWHRVTQFAYDGTGAPTKPTVLDVTPKWMANNLTADNWTVSAGMAIDTSDQKYGTQSMRMATDGTNPRSAYQDVVVKPNTDYVLSGYIKASGNPAAHLRVEETNGTEVVKTPNITATQDWTRTSIGFNSGGRTVVRVVVRSAAGTAGAYAWFDALKLEASPVVTPWTPGFVGEGTTIDSGGIQVDASAGGVFRLRAASGGSRDIVELYQHGLRFGTDVEVSSVTSGVLNVGGDLYATGLLTSAKARTYSFQSTSGATTYLPSAILPNGGALMVTTDGNDFVALANFFRGGGTPSYNVISGSAFGSGPGGIEFRGTTFSPGAANFSVYLESGSGGARIAVKENWTETRVLTFWIIG